MRRSAQWNTNIEVVFSVSTEKSTRIGCRRCRWTPPGLGRIKVCGILAQAVDVVLSVVAFPGNTHHKLRETSLSVVFALDVLIHFLGLCKVLDNAKVEGKAVR